MPKGIVTVAQHEPRVQSSGEGINGGDREGRRRVIRREVEALRLSYRQWVFRAYAARLIFQTGPSTPVVDLSRLAPNHPEGQKINQLPEKPWVRYHCMVRQVDLDSSMRIGKSVAAYGCSPGRSARTISPHRHIRPFRRRVSRVRLPRDLLINFAFSTPPARQARESGSLS